MSRSDLNARDPGIDAENFSAGVAVSAMTLEDVRRVVAWCARQSVSLVTQGGRTGLAGGAASSPGQLILMMDKFDSIREIDAASGVAVVDAGVTLSQLEDEVRALGLSVGVDFGARGSCTIGGMVATNAGGAEAFRHGVMRQRVLGLEVVLPNGAVLSDLKKVAKANEGYDIKQLFIGSEGTLGVITGVVLKLVPAIQRGETALVAAPDARSALAVFQQLRRVFGSELLAAEIMWRDYFLTTAGELGIARKFGHLQGEVFVIFSVTENVNADDFLETLADCMERDEITDVVIAKNEQEQKGIWQVREESFLIDRVYPSGCWFDISIPLSSLDEFVRESSARLRALCPELGIFIMGHLGDGNLHYTIASEKPVEHLYKEISKVLFAGLAEIGGSFSAEHGIGSEKRESLVEFGDPVKLALMAAAKQTIDPQNMMNPGKILKLS